MKTKFIYVVLMALFLGSQMTLSAQNKENKERKHIKDAKYGWYRYDIRFGIPVYDDKTGLLIRYNIFTAILL